MATSFKSIWALVSDSALTPGTPVPVSLKSGETKQIVVGFPAGVTRDGRYLYTVGSDDQNNRADPGMRA